MYNACKKTCVKTTFHRKFLFELNLIINCRELLKNTPGKKPTKIGPKSIKPTKQFYMNFLNCTSRNALTIGTVKLATC